MWLICFQPNGSSTFVPQVLCYTEEQAKEWLQNMPFSAVGSYSYMYVPIGTMGNYWHKQEPKYAPNWQWPTPVVPYYEPPRRQWQIEVGDWPGSYPVITC